MDGLDSQALFSLILVLIVVCLLAVLESTLQIVLEVLALLTQNLCVLLRTVVVWEFPLAESEDEEQTLQETEDQKV